MFQAFNILRYEIGQKYNSHYDAFNPSEYGPQKSQRVSLNYNFYILIYYCNLCGDADCGHALTSNRGLISFC